MRGFALLAWVSLAFSGCVAPAVVDPVDPAASPLSTGALPQLASHPAFGWPTLGTAPAEPPAWWRAIAPRELPATIAGLDHVASYAEATDPVGHIAILGGRMVTTGYGLAGAPPPARVFDVSDPAAPVLLGEVATRVATRDVDLIAYPDGRLVAVFSTDSKLLLVHDITDPSAAEELAVIQPPAESTTHDVAVVPGTPIAYNANSQGSRTTAMAFGYPGGIPRGITEIYDLTDPAEPILVKEFENGYGCHGINFHITPEKQRAYCAGIEAVQIWDIADPRDPKVISTTPFPPLPNTLFPAPLRLAHVAMANDDATVMVVGDETGAGALAACDPYMEPKDEGPLGNVYFYDIRDETRPVLTGKVAPSPYFATNPPPHAGPFTVAGCTAHWGAFIPHPEQRLLAFAFYGAGVVLIDYEDLAAPRIVDQWNEGTNTWDVWYADGWLFTGDLARGADALAFR